MGCLLYTSKQSPQQPKKSSNKEKNKISGRVLDENNEPLIGVTITQKGTNNRAVDVYKRQYKDSLKTITTDNGPEFAAHKDITKFLGVPVYFADPYCSWQKGAIENTNKLIRQYIPKKDSFEHYTDKRIMSIQKKLNERPREKLNFSTPKCEFFKYVL